jgi:Ran GTPase-activating protein (RanGAP) involved in mRNA processing and transport
LSSFLKQNTTLVKLFLGDMIDDISVASELSDAIKNHPNIGLLAFNKCGLSNNPGILETVLEGCTRVMLVSVSNEKLGMEGVALLARFIRSNYPTEILSFRDNEFTDDDMLVLASALRINTNLERLILQDNNFTEEGDKILLKAVYDPTSMDTIIESNHSCRAHTYDIKSSWLVLRRPSNETEVFNINADDEISIQQKIRKKVVLALCGVDGGLFDLSHFNDLPLGVMPRVLELIQEHSEARAREFRSMPVPNEILDSLSVSFEQYQRKQLEKDALSRLFHTLRGWELPLLFENLNTSVTSGKMKRRKIRR